MSSMTCRTYEAVRVKFASIENMCSKYCSRCRVLLSRRCPVHVSQIFVSRFFLSFLFFFVRCYFCCCLLFHSTRLRVVVMTSNIILASSLSVSWTIWQDMRFLCLFSVCRESCQYNDLSSTSPDLKSSIQLPDLRRVLTRDFSDLRGRPVSVNDDFSSCYFCHTRSVVFCSIIFLCSIERHVVLVSIFHHRSRSSTYVFSKCNIIPE